MAAKGLAYWDASGGTGKVWMATGLNGAGRHQLDDLRRRGGDPDPVAMGADQRRDRGECFAIKIDRKRVVTPHFLGQKAEVGAFLGACSPWVTFSSEMSP